MNGNERGALSHPRGVRETEEFRGVAVGRDVVEHQSADRIELEDRPLGRGYADVVEFEVVRLLDEETDLAGGVDVGEAVPPRKIQFPISYQ